MKTLFELWRHYLNYEDIIWVMKTLFELLVDDIHWYTVVWLNSYHGNKLTKGLFCYGTGAIVFITHQYWKVTLLKKR